ncbi:hypothetical protein [Orenia marismortui]|uniref:Uncharacterized protein n=1 Tax=Orenia marismortui TaxID=46469 RepID=A0A4R8H8K7_9FIRM|nr:hypothetical protein [Orenia marismortui]TDX52132.1 hypothetical protein C7959_10854 [Orenia marismortui]
MRRKNIVFLILILFLFIVIGCNNAGTEEDKLLLKRITFSQRNNQYIASGIVENVGDGIVSNAKVLIVFFETSAKEKMITRQIINLPNISFSERYKFEEILETITSKKELENFTLEILY